MKSNQQRGNLFANFFVVIPIIVIFLSVNQKVKLPLDQVKFLTFALIVFLISFFLLWRLSFPKIKIQGVFWGVLGFTAFFWLISTIFGLALINKLADTGPSSIHYRGIIRIHQSLPGTRGKSTPTCTLWFDKPLLGVKHSPVKYVECDHIEVNHDGVQYKIKNGLLGFQWIEEYSIIKDLKTFKERMRISEE